MKCQKDQFNLSPSVHYINCATRGPFSKKVEAAGYQAIQNLTPLIHTLTPTDFFEPVWEVRALFARLLNTSATGRIAVIPSVSYAMSVVACNLPAKAGLRAGQKILLLEGEFPSDVYAWERVARQENLSIQTVAMPDTKQCGADWNTAILEAITPETALVVCPHVHWMYGFLFDLQEISRKAKAVGAWLVVDTTQSVGALPFDVEKIQPDMVVSAGYKWLMGPYSLGLAYFGEVFDGGIPLEETWMARQDSHLFHKLTDYQAHYQPEAFRYNMGEQSNFTQMPMLKVALEQILDWNPAEIQAYCRTLFREAIPVLEQAGFWLEPEEFRAAHLLGLRLPEHVNPMDLHKKLVNQQVYVSVRGSGLRISPNVYNDAADVQALVRALLD
ncbi:aminotransferase class V-fold PLP-dependent enzyme [Arundinibacter roseus]|uniref:Aminotransferase class V-fold PLP-dependent enzyme n=1 Tax=Arundinibacter roseus TaxID=2070510 RepID=A0A4R4KF57_9BACT|nr:aminotransferase class V-fold PLP-dependent enzyme [Arundinibacter roseus]TDB65089.1 aminotransferase class V-fold PLP-dependent enzyme [Arundinibacter roseus]